MFQTEELRSRGGRVWKIQGVAGGPAHGLRGAGMRCKLEGQGVPADLGSQGGG